MKLYGLYEEDNVPDLEFNHRKFCDQNNIVYNKIICNKITQKYYAIYNILRQNVGETIIFIDSYSMFRTFDINLKFDQDILIQGINNKLHDNFFVVKSNTNTLKIFKNLLGGCWQIGNKLDNMSQLFPKEYILNYPAMHDGKHFNVSASLHSNALHCSDLWVVNLHLNDGVASNNHSFANIMCNYQKMIYQHKTSKFEVINPGQDKALVTLYTDNIKDFSIISEINIARYCKLHNITYYVYREVPQELSRMKGNWCKPFLLLNHLDQHQYVGWIDSDILINTKYKMQFTQDVHVYHDPCSWFFNSGYMMFKNTSKNKQMLQEVVEEINNLSDLNSVYVNGGDQFFFIKKYQKFYPDTMPHSSSLGNSHPMFPYYLDPKDPYMFHFMGYLQHLRTAFMDKYEQIISKQYVETINQS